MGRVPSWETEESEQRAGEPVPSHPTACLLARHRSACLRFPAAERGFCPGPHSAALSWGSPRKRGMEMGPSPSLQPARQAQACSGSPWAAVRNGLLHYRQHLGPTRCCPALLGDAAPSSHQNTWRQQSDRVGRPWTRYTMKLGMVTHSLKDPPTQRVLRASTPEIKADLTCGQLVGKAGVEISLKAKSITRSVRLWGGRSPGGDGSVTGVSGRQGPRS